MSDPENFVARWSRLKRQSHLKDAPKTDPGLEPEAPPRDAPPGTAGPQPSPPAIDLESLPSIESITAETDIRAFLQSGVPAELTKAALRRVWTTDPAIRDFIGIAENQWDFTDPTAMPGFGPLLPSDDVRKLVSQAMGKFGQSAEQVVADAPPAHDPSATSGLPSGSAGSSSGAGIQHTGTPDENPSDPSPDLVPEKQKQVHAATQHGEASEHLGTLANRRSHGGALPK